MGDVIPFDAERAARAVRSTRPAPTLDPDAPDGEDDFAPSPELEVWAESMFIREEGPLHNPRHAHLLDARIGWLWTTARHLERGQAVVGQCRMVQPIQSKWSSAMMHWLYRLWFGQIPDFVIVVDAVWAAQADDWSFCALIEHELCHAGQDVDAFGEPRFGVEGQPIFRLVGHDVEQFNDVVARYGAVAAGVDVMTRLANAGPVIGEAQIAAACGTCKRRTG